MVGVGDIADGLLAADDGAVRAALGQELKRLGDVEPAAALGVATDASAETVRARFLALTKIYHPNRFARRPADVVKLANEVFLRLRRAYERAGERPAPPERAGGTAPPAAGAGAGSAAATGGNGPATSTRASDLSPPSQPKLDVEAALARRRRKRSHPGVSSIGGPSATEVLEKARRRDEEQKERLQTALVDLQQGRLPEARTALRTLVADNPSERRYRAYLHYVTGRLHEASGRAGDAVAEYDRALTFDPDLAPALRSRQVLTGTSARGEAKPSGRWFRK
jgi:tetratricopeptide (TPR) repeat protein